MLRAVLLQQLLLLLLSLLRAADSQGSTDLVAARAWLDNYNAQYSAIRTEAVNTSWIYNTNLTDYNNQISIQASLRVTAFRLESARNASALFDWRRLSNATVVREFSKITDIGTAALDDPVKQQRLSELRNAMSATYSTAKVTMSDGRVLSLDPGLTDLLTRSRNYDELLEAWLKWHEVTGPQMKTQYEEFVALSNEAIRVANYSDLGAYWRSWYERPQFQQEVEAAWQQLLPLYQHLHAYVRRHLVQRYGNDKFPASGHIPAHIFGNMWAQEWGALYADLQPFPGGPDLDVTDKMVQQNYTAIRIFNVSDQFFANLGLEPMPPEFWQHSMLEKPSDGREVTCHASAWDFMNQRDFRVKQCTEATMDHLITAHHEMGHIEYYLLYKNQPVSFREGSNPGFHEAVGDVISLSVQTPKHLHEIGLLDTPDESPDGQINFLMKMALSKIAFLPFGYLMDQWRWSVFNGATTPAQYNQRWWDLRCRYQGIYHPSYTWPENAFDPGAKFHIPANVPYIRYFVSFVYQFQFHKALCVLANQTGPLHQCDIQNSKEAGTALRAMLSLGSSVPWPDAMQALTGQREMNADPLVEYFQPLIDWLEQKNAGQRVGWDEGCPVLESQRSQAISAHAHMAAVLLTSLLAVIFLA